MDDNKHEIVNILDNYIPELAIKFYSKRAEMADIGGSDSYTIADREDSDRTEIVFKEVLTELRRLSDYLIKEMVPELQYLAK
jgi:hypothetical protein